MWSFVQEKKKEGKIRHVGFSFHSTPEELEAILKAHPEMEFVQLQINYGDWENPAVQSRACYEMARKYDKPVIIMEPVKGGMLANPPESVQEILKAAEPEASCASWAVRFVAKGFRKLTPSQEKTIEKAREALAKIPIIPCTTCNYCAKVCPQDIGISGSFTAMNYLTLYGDKAAAKSQENWLVNLHDRKPAADCVKCGACEKACPQHIRIRDELEKAAKALA